MKELSKILKEAARLEAAGASYALATVVDIGGSTYRRPGARMLVDPDGDKWGTLSGGCLEGEVAQQAFEVMDHGLPQLLPFDMSDDDIILGFGTGCNGVVHVLIEPVPGAGRSNPLALLNVCLQSRKMGVLATVIDASGTLDDSLGRHLLVLKEEAMQGCLTASPLYEAVREDAWRDLQLEQSHVRRYTWQNRRYEIEGGTAEVLFEVVRPPVRLVIFGEGHDVGPVVRFGKALGWQVVVVGRKPPEVLRERFPEADEAAFLMHPDQALEQVALDDWSAALVMNHNYTRDRTLLHVLLQSTVPYVGMLGPRERTDLMIEELREAGEELSEARLERLYGPVGLDIGTETPEEIALSIIAEIQSALHGRQGGALRHRDGPIHEARAAIV